MTSKGTIALLAVIPIFSPFCLQAESETDAFSQSLAGSLEVAGRKLIALAEATPAEEFSRRPVEGVRSISQVYMHVVGNNFQIPAALGADPPEGIEIPERPYDRRMQKLRWEEEVREKEQVVELLERSFEYALNSIPKIGELDDVAAPLGFRATKRDYLLLLANHAHEHLGQSISYARGAGVVPPWSRAPDRPRADSVAVLEDERASGEIVSIDQFGNIVTNLVATDIEWLSAAIGDSLVVQVGESTAEVFWGESMMDVSDGEWFAVVNSGGTVTIGRSYENAGNTLACQVGDSISFRHAERDHGGNSE